MITYKIDYKCDDINKLENYIKQYNIVYRYAYNRYQDNQQYKSTEIAELAKQKLSNIQLLDIKSIEQAIAKSKNLQDKKIIFGGKANYFKYIKGLISKKEYQNKKLTSYYIRGNKKQNGNRKFVLDIKNNYLIFKANKNNHFQLRLSLNKNLKSNLEIIQRLTKKKEMPLNIGFDLEYVYLSFQETFLEYKPIKYIKNRILSLDLNPNYISYVICDYNKENRTNTIKKQIISLKQLNDLDKRKNYKQIQNKQKYRKHLHNKRKYQTLQIVKRIFECAKYYRCETVCIEKLNIKSYDKSKGKRFNKQCNNDWLRKIIVNNLQKRCNIYNIRLQQVVAQYSSFIGQFTNLNDYDSIAASYELGRRCNLYIRNYIKHENDFINDKGELQTPKSNIVYPKFHFSTIDLWKKKLQKYGDFTISNWKQFYKIVKEAKLSYRLLFDNNKNIVSSRLNSKKSLAICYCL